MDTDINSIREREWEGYRGYSVRMGGNISVAACLEQDTDASEQWYPKNEQYYHKSIGEGAGQVRAISRLAFQRTVRIGALRPLHNAIKAMHMENGGEQLQELKIVIVTTIAGGTGSGSVLPLGLHIKDYMNREYSGSGVKINTFLALPDILESVGMSQKETQNLNANGYAAVKEIDAFINGEIKGRGIVLSNEKNVALHEFRENPFDFCFVFGKLSKERFLYDNVEEYKDMIAKCLITQMLGVLSEKNFSKEDNVLASSMRIMEGKIKMERFAGAGCSVVRYPYKEIREYLSLRWALDTMKVEWTKYDEKRKSLYEECLKKQSQGDHTQKLSQEELFIEAVKQVDGEYKERDENYVTYEEWLNELSRKNNGKGLLEFLKDFIEENIEANRSGLIRQEKDAFDIVAEGRIKKTERLREHLQQYKMYAEDIKEENYKIFDKLSLYIKSDICRFHGGEIKPRHLEYYLCDDQNRFMSPNYIRFYLYTTAEELAARSNDLKGSLDNDTKSIITSLKDWDEENVSNLKKRSSIIKSMEQYRNVYQKMEDMLSVQLEFECISELLKYVKKILNRYEEFFQEYSQLLTMMEKQTDEMDRRFNDSKIKMEHWVCADHKCLSDMMEEMRNMPIYNIVGDEISLWLFEKNSKPKEKKQYLNLADSYDEIREIWGHQFDVYYKKFFDKNVLEALEREAAQYIDKPSEIDIFKYMDRRMEEVKNSTSIQIAVCRKPPSNIRRYCVYSKMLKNAAKKYKDLMKKYFEIGMSASDNTGMDVDEKSILFYEIGYGYLPEDIDFFGASKGKFAGYPIGDGTWSYQWIVKNYCRQKTAKITPHIDNEWHESDIETENCSDFKSYFIFEQVIWVMYFHVLTETDIFLPKQSPEAGKILSMYKHYSQNKEAVESYHNKIEQEIDSSKNINWTKYTEEKKNNLCNIFTALLQKLNDGGADSKKSAFLKEKMKQCLECFFEFITDKRPECKEDSDEWREKNPFIRQQGHADF